MCSCRVPTNRRPKAPRSGARGSPPPSPFAPIADDAFLSDCHTGALVAPGLYAEELYPDTSGHLGTVPQAFSHLALIVGAARIIVAESLTDVAA